MVYHGSPTSGIKVFEMNEALFGEGAFFTNVAEEALDYTGLELLDYEDMWVRWMKQRWSRPISR